MSPLRCSFGTTPAGEPIELITLVNGALSCSILTFGATLQSLCVPDRTGQPVDIVLGYDTLEEYCTQDGYLGAVVGRYANRIAGGRFILQDRQYVLASNNGPNHLHGGRVGFSHRVWMVEVLTSHQAILTLNSPDGEEGYPGNLQVQVTYTLEKDALTISYKAVSDQDTPCNLTNHSYFNLTGHDSGSILSQKIAIFASRYIPTDAMSIPLGILAPVANTPMDLRQPTSIGSCINLPFQQLLLAGGYDHNYVLEEQREALVATAQAFSSVSGITMTVETTLPGVQFYTANSLRPRRGKHGTQYGPRHGFCLETQFFPDSPNQPSFPSSILHAGEQWSHATRFIFTHN